MKISNTLLPILLLVAPVLVASYTQALTTPFVPDECDSLMDGVCRQSCTRGGCTMECFNSEHYHSCDQGCTGGNCDMTYSAPTKCDFSCTLGNCQTVICKADTCYESCTGGGCGLECHGNSCEQSCTSGNCDLQCPSDAVKCEQRCTLNKDKCTITYV